MRVPGRRAVAPDPWVAAQRGFRRLPRGVRLALTRLVTPNFTVGAVAVIESAGEALFLRQHHRHGWGLPGGLLDRGEEPDQAVRRETREETGLSIEVGAPLLTLVSARRRWVDVVYHVPLPDRPPVHPASEAHTHGWFPLDAVPDADPPTRMLLAAITRALSR